ncbi:MAG: hypothetical protein LBK94_07260 [Prevotellaceae bacterium]|nr:hypothetical protein [Prevotellaceae bacterium]
MKTVYSNFRAIFFNVALVIPIFGMFLLISCATTKKTSVAAEVNTVATVETNELKTSEILSFVDTTKIADAEITYTKIEFYPPAADTAHSPPRNDIAPDGIINSIDKPPVVKSVETLNIKYNTEQKGVSQNSMNITDSIRQNAVFINSQKVDATTEQKAKNRLKYVMWIAICATVMTAIIYIYKFLKK